jgi:hypothetical protein
VGAGGTGLFAKPDSHYGEIWYEIAGKRVMLRSAIEQLVLQGIYDLAGIKAAPSAESEKFSGYPLNSSAPFAWIVFFVALPVIILTVFVKLRGR